MNHPDLTPSVMTGLGWYYLLAAMLNASAAAFVAYLEMVSEGGSRAGLDPRTRRVPGWMVTSALSLFGLATLILAFQAYLPAGMVVAYFLCASATALIAVGAGADAAHHAEIHSAGHGIGSDFHKPTLDDHIPAIGLGRPINRTLWALVWAVVSVVFQAIGLAYILGAWIVLPSLVRDAVDALSGPTTFFVGSTLLFYGLYRFRRILASGLVAWSLTNLGLLAFGLSMTDWDFRGIVTKPDNVPIIGLIVLVGFFTWIGLRRAVINDARMARGLPNLEELQPEKTLTWPDLVYTELIAMIGLTVFLTIWAIVLQAPLEEPASSTVAPNPSKAPWYFLGLQEMLVYFDPWMAGVVLPTMIIVGLMALPFIDNNKRGNGYYTIDQRTFAWLTFQYGYLVLWVILILLGTFLRGPNWNFFGPYEYWDLHKVIPLNNVNLSDIVWIQMLGQKRPESILLRELPGILACLAYFTIVPAILYRFVFRTYAQQAGIVRFLTLALLLLFMASLPIKMVLRWTINLKYLVAIPEYFFNI